MFQRAVRDHVVEFPAAAPQFVGRLAEAEEKRHAACSCRLGCRPAIVLALLPIVLALLRRHLTAPVASERQQRARACTDVIVPPIYFLSGRNPADFSPNPATSFGC